MTHSGPPNRLIDADGEVPELGDGFLERARPGRPALPIGKKRERVNLMLDPELRAEAKARGLNLSERVNTLLRKNLGLQCP